ncbi:MAG: hypothetical protein JO147_01965 [Actinobacteria bacterium]|nr:hypothetical protein [Actinomycetota bacterium]
MDDSTPEFTEVEWLDGDDPAPLSHGTRRAPRRRVGYLLAVATVVAVVIAVIVQHDGGPSPHSQAVRSSATSHPVSVAPVSLTR